MDKIFSRLCRNVGWSVFKRNLSNVTVKQGKLQGLEKKLRSGKTYFSFKGIPYAKPPLGPLRFRPPEPPEAWVGTKEAFNHGNVCPHYDQFTGKFVGDEDCLYLNVYTPYHYGKSLPVMVYIHGGAFKYESGNSDVYGPEILLEENVILVTLNYRYEVFGFLCLNNEMVPGNAGLKDQVAALKWVQENIDQFGGDPNNVTLFGGSAGGASAFYHYLSPMSKNLAHKFGSQSGNYLCGWSHTENEIERALTLCKYLGGDPQTDHEILNFIKKQPPQALAKISFQLQTPEEKKVAFARNFTPVVEEFETDSDRCFLPKSTAELFKDNMHRKDPIIYGFNYLETLYRWKLLMKMKPILNENLKCRIPLRLARNISEEQADLFGKKIKKFFFNDDPNGISEENLLQTLDLEADFVTIVDTITFVKMFTKHSASPVYFNRFSFEGDLNFYKKLLIGNKKLHGATHCDDQFYLFSNSFEKNVSIDERTDLMRRKMARMWTNFAKHGNPTPSKDDLIDVIWTPATYENCDFLEIDEPMMMKKDPVADRYKFWSDMYREAGMDIDPIA